MINLSQREQDRFAAYLKQEAVHCGDMVKQMAHSNVLKVIVEKYKAEGAACTVVYRMLTSGEEMTVHG